jgi:hypothetical protein
LHYTNILRDILGQPTVPAATCFMTRKTLGRRSQRLPPASFRPLVLSQTSDRHARPRQTVAVHAGSHIGSLKEACWFLLDPPPSNFRDDGLAKD